MKSWSVVVTALFLVIFSSPVVAHWLGGPSGYGGRWGGGGCRMMDVTSQPVDPASLPQPHSPGAQLLQTRCVQCHGLVSPRQEAALDWSIIVDRMDRRMRMMGRGGMGMMMRADLRPLTEEENNTLLDYLQRNAFKAIPPAALANSGDPNQQAFVEICSRCHALPDPGSYSSAEWRIVVERMAGNMEQMDFGSLTPEQKKAILEYLQKNARK